MAKRALDFRKKDLAELVGLRGEIEAALSGKILIEPQELQSRIADLTALEHRRSKAANGMRHRLQSPPSEVQNQKPRRIL
jgi:hypothetical protein